jgi:enterochelin esterase family protein
MGVLLLMQADSVQQELLGQFESPKVHADGKVTFRFESQHANEITLEGIAGHEAAPLKRGTNGMWELTVGPLAPELYSYYFKVDGTRVADPHNRYVKKWLTVENMFLVPGDPPLLHEQTRVPHGTVHHHLYESETTGGERGLYIYTPPGYQDNTEQKYPLLILMHGYGDDESAWLEVGRANFIVDNLLAARKVKPMVIAMPYGHPLPLELKAEFDDYAGRNIVLIEKDVLQDLLPFVNERYRVSEQRQSRAIVGLSMGGGQSLTIGMKHLETFAWIGGYSSACPETDLEDSFAQILADVPAANKRIDLLWIGCGEKDFLLDRNRKFVNWLKEQGIEHTYRETAGAHEWSVWRKYLAEFLPLLFRS